MFVSNFELTGSTFEGDLYMECTSKGGVLFDKCVFKQRALFRGVFHGPALFNWAVFHDAVEFRGGWIHTGVIGTADSPERPVPPRYVFNGDVHLEAIDFRRPDRVQFRMVDLSQALTMDTDFRKTRFDEIKWCTFESRKGLYVERWANPSGGPSRLDAMIEGSYRNIRAALEESRDFQSATDFYIGEMEARRRQLSTLQRKFFSIEWMYWIASSYGGNPMRAFVVLFGLLTFYGILTAVPLGKVCLYPLQACELSADPVLRALSLVEISKAAEGTDLTGWWKVVAIVFRVLVVIQVALLGLALRSRIKRA
jgi:hypothetical protein